MSRGWKIALGASAAIVGVNLALSALQALTGGSPGGPRSSSYATGADGAGAYAELLARNGHEVRRERVTPHEATLDSGETAVVLDPPFVVGVDARALREFVRAGGRLVAADDGAGWLRRVLPDAPRGDALGVRRPAVLRGLPHVDRVVTAGEHAWTERGGALPLVGRRGRTVAAVASLGNGRVFAVADSSPLQNALLDRADNAALGLALAGPSARPVVFFEGYHGYGRGSGLGALPARWKAAFVLAGLAALVFIAARARRLGPPEAEERPLDPPRREYVEALAATIARTRDRAEALEPVRDELRRRVAVRSGLGAGASDEQLAAAARRLGLRDDEVEAVLQPPRDERATLAAGRALARLAERRDGWTN